MARKGKERIEEEWKVREDGWQLRKDREIWRDERRGERERETERLGKGGKEME